MISYMYLVEEEALVVRPRESCKGFQWGVVGEQVSSPLPLWKIQSQEVTAIRPLTAPDEQNYPSDSPREPSKCV